MLDLLGADPNEAIPQSLEEARELAGYVRPQHAPPLLCPVTDKHSFPSDHAARQAITNRLRKGSNTGALRAYLCEHCSLWHMSSSYHR